MTRADQLVDRADAYRAAVEALTAWLEAHDPRRRSWTEEERAEHAGLARNVYLSREALLTAAQTNPVAA